MVLIAGSASPSIQRARPACSPARARHVPFTSRIAPYRADTSPSSWGERGLRLTDLGSTNGTLVNAMPVVEMFLQGGEHIRIGASTLRVSARPAAEAPEPSRATGFGRLVGSSLVMRRLYPLCERLAQSTVPVIIEGETGTGKEVLAESLHEHGPGAAGPFVVFDCTAVAPNLVESELFGHERGAFTGATATRKGVFEQAQGGTLLIDEIGDLVPELQSKLLRAIRALRDPPRRR